MSHPLLTDLLRPLYHLESQVKAMSLQRLEFEALTDHTDIVTPGGRFYKDPSAFAINHYSQRREPACMLCCRLQPRCRSGNTFDICLTRIFAFLFAVLLSVLSILHFSVFYQCYDCQEPYFAGARACGVAGAEEVKREDLICGGCQKVPSFDECPKHGSSFLIFKCRFCCSFSTYYCFGKSQSLGHKRTLSVTHAATMLSSLC